MLYFQVVLMRAVSKLVLEVRFDFFVKNWDFRVNGQPRSAYQKTSSMKQQIEFKTLDSLFPYLKTKKKHSGRPKCSALKYCMNDGKCKIILEPSSSIFLSSTYYNSIKSWNSLPEKFRTLKFRRKMELHQATLSSAMEGMPCFFFYKTSRWIDFQLLQFFINSEFQTS